MIGRRPCTPRIPRVYIILPRFEPPALLKRTNEWTDGPNEWTNEWTHGPMNGPMNCPNEWTNEATEWTNEWTNGPNERMNVWNG